MMGEVVCRHLLFFLVHHLEVVSVHGICETFVVNIGVIVLLRYSDGQLGGLPGFC